MKKRGYSVWVLLCILSVLAFGLSSGVAGNDPTFNCTDPPVWNHDAPSLSGSAKVGFVLTAATGAVRCADQLRATFYRTDANGNNAVTVKTGSSQACIDPAHVDCFKTDTYTPTAQDVGGFIKVVWTANNVYWSIGKSMNPLVFGAIASAGGSPPTNTGAPSMSGSLVPGKLPLCTQGSWNGATSYQISYQTLPSSDIADQEDLSTSTPLRTNHTGDRVRCRVIASNQYGSTQAYSARSGSSVALQAITYDVYIGASFKNRFEVRFPGCDEGQLCARTASFIELFSNFEPTCPAFDLSASSWSANGGPQSNLTPNDHIRSGPAHQNVDYQPVTSGANHIYAPGQSAWHFKTGTENLNTCRQDVQTYWVQEDQGTAPYPNDLVNGPPLNVSAHLEWDSLDPRGQHRIWAPVIVAEGDIGGVGSFIQTGYFRGYMDPATGCNAPGLLDPDKTYAYVEMVSDATNGSLTCGSAGSLSYAAKASSGTGWDIYFYNTDQSVRDRAFELRYFDSR